MLLKLVSVSRHFGGIRAVDGIDLEIAPGEIVGLIGPNGAGKTTLVNLLSGLIQPTAGEIYFRGVRIDRLPAHQITALGITRTFQNIRLFSKMSVLENVAVGSHAVTRSGLLSRLFFLPAEAAEERSTHEHCLSLLERVGLGGRAQVRADSLSYGDRRRLEIARALAADPKLLLLDEPLAGMTHGEAGPLAELLRSLVAEGQTILLIEHNVSFVMSVCERVAVLNFGQKIADGTPTQVSADPKVIEAYLGQEE